METVALNDAKPVKPPHSQKNKWLTGLRPILLLCQQKHSDGVVEGSRGMNG